MGRQSTHAKNEDPQGHQKEISLDGKRKGQASQGGHEPLADPDVAETETESAGNRNIGDLCRKADPGGSWKEQLLIENQVIGRSV